MTTPSHGYPNPGPQHPTGQDVTNHAFFCTDQQWEQARTSEAFDFVVIGTGVCGYAFVQRILETDPHVRILMIERGPFFLPEHFQNLAVPFQHTLGAPAETFPWTLSPETALQPAGSISWQHGMIPFVGGRSIMWSSWCPRPTPTEMQYWPAETIAAAARHFDTAEQLLNVVPADQIDQNLTADNLAAVPTGRPVYATLQKRLQSTVADNLHNITTATRSMAAPMAVGAGIEQGLDFAKFSVPPDLLNLIDVQAQRHAAGAGSPLTVVTDCTVERIQRDGATATALETSRGNVDLGDAQVVLAMGTLPPTTLIQNSFPEITSAGARFTAHFITSVVARVKRSDYSFADELADLELGAIYVAGANAESGMQYHVQLSVLSDKHPDTDEALAARYMPDVVATASPEQLADSGDHVVFVCASLGELDFNNPSNRFAPNNGTDPTTNVTLEVLANDTDNTTWHTMDQATFQLIENVLSPNGPAAVEYWHGDPDNGDWTAEQPPIEQRRVGGLVHEGSTLWIGTDAQSPTGLDYRPQGIDNVYVTGGALWPAAGSWNPTMTMVALVHDLVDQLQHN